MTGTGFAANPTVMKQEDLPPPLREQLPAPPILEELPLEDVPQPPPDNQAPSVEHPPDPFLRKG